MTDHERFIRRTRDKIARAHPGFFIGAVDLSLNEHLQKKHRPHWCRHVHGFVSTNKPKALKRKLKKQFSATDLIPRPVNVQPWDGDSQAIRYALKSQFDRRINSDNGQRFDKKIGKSRKCKDTDIQPLKSTQRLELLLHVDDIGIAGRLLLRGVQFLNLKGAGPTLVDRPVKARSLDEKREGSNDEKNVSQKAKNKQLKLVF